MVVPSIPEEEEEEPEVIDAPDLWARDSMTTVEIDPPPAGDPSPAGEEPTVATNPMPACHPQLPYNGVQEMEYYNEHANPLEPWEPDAVTETASAGDLPPAGAYTDNPQQAHGPSASRNAVEAETNSLNQIAAGLEPLGCNWMENMVDVFDAAEAREAVRDNNAISSLPAGGPILVDIATPPNGSVDLDAAAAASHSFTTTTMSSLVAQQGDG